MDKAYNSYSITLFYMGVQAIFLCRTKESAHVSTLIASYQLNLSLHNRVVLNILKDFHGS